MNEPPVRTRTLTIVAAGPPDAGKGTLVSTLAGLRPAALPARILHYRLEAGRVLTVELSPVRLEDGLAVRPRLLTLSGAAGVRGAWGQLLALADVALFVADARSDRDTANADAYAAFRQDLSQLTAAGVPPVVLLVTRVDDPAARSAAATIQGLAVQGPHFAANALDASDLVPALAEAIVCGIEDLEGRERPESRDLVARQLTALAPS